MMGKEGLSKFEKILALIIALSMLVISVLTLLNTYGILSIKEKPKTTASYSITRIDAIDGYDSIEQYKLYITNTEKLKATDLEIQITFPENMTIYRNFGSETDTFIKDMRSSDSHSYNISYSKIRESETIEITIFLVNSEFKAGETWIVKPIRQDIWTGEEGKIEIS